LNKKRKAEADIERANARLREAEELEAASLTSRSSTD